jgi:DNA-binding NtrC family response regulator
MNRQLLIVDDQESILFFLRKTLEAEGYVVETAGTGASALGVARETQPDVVLLDMRLPDCSGVDLIESLRQECPDGRVVMMTAFGDVESCVTAMKRGAFDYLNKPIKLEELLDVLGRALATNRSRSRVQQLRRERTLFQGSSEYVPSVAPAMAHIYEIIDRISCSDSSTVLIEGESGSGKDVISNLIHRASSRNDHAFLEINCASLPETLLESELFGHEKGAFTDAVNQKMGLMELANRGTLFLDEIGEMSLTIQVKLLRVLEKMTFRRVGGVKDIQVDVRIIAATNRNLRQSVELGTFREDLYYRLNVLPLHIPPLRDRPEDIPVLAEHFLQQFSQRFEKRFTRIDDEANRVLVDYGWPGNIRELKNLMERVVLLEDAEVLEAGHLHFLRQPIDDAADIIGEIEQAIRQTIPPDGLAFEKLVTGLERSLIEKAYRAADGNQSQTAKLLNLNRDKLRYRMKSFDLL